MPAVGRAGFVTKRRKGRLEGVQLTCSFLSVFHSVIRTLGGLFPEEGGDLGDGFKPGPGHDF